MNFKFISTGLHKTMLEIAATDAGENEKKRTEVQNSVRTLDNLHSALENPDCKLNQTATYYCLTSANAHHKDAKRYLNTVVV